MHYEYPPITGYTWNGMQKVALALGIDISLVVFSSTWNKTIVDINTEITEDQKLILDEVMSNNPCSIPQDNQKTMMKIPDLWSMREWFFQQWGIEAVMWFEKGNEDGSGECYIHLQFPRILTDIEKDKVKAVFSNFIIY